MFVEFLPLYILVVLVIIAIILPICVVSPSKKPDKNPYVMGIACYDKSQDVQHVGCRLIIKVPEEEL